MEMELDLGRWRGVGGGAAMVENVVEVGAEVVGAEGVAGGDHGLGSCGLFPGLDLF